ncbi:TetR/AcrR family transcriptional regulator [Butyrivibrio sp. AE2032]|uniref:TetR/AcrR family transcriptional regulator n=1 Tax=Butyrivibrio sp. AE2032 TaxID=1458463 RepID=UPI00068B10FE|nr:TetR/AcrR family transcriptional regulator [Butyrivibrio sp. AE2032]
MPRVSEEYFEKKRKEIIDAAYRVCTRKPITSIEMKDIIAETGFSHGVIYRYYKDIDEVFKDLVITINSENKIDDRLDEILNNADIRDWEQTIYDICQMLADYMKEVGTDLLKVSIYGDMLAMTDPERAMNIAKRLGKDEQSPLLYATEAMTDFLTKAVKQNKLKPAVPVDQIIQFFIVNYHGIQSGYVLTDCFKAEHIKGKYKVDDMYRNLATSVVLMMGGKARTN